MGTWLVVADFEYRYDKKGEPYGWGIARYTTPGSTVRQRKVQAAGNRSPGRVKTTLDRLPHTIIAASNTGANSEYTRIKCET